MGNPEFTLVPQTGAIVNLIKQILINENEVFQIIKNGVVIAEITSPQGFATTLTITARGKQDSVNNLHLQS